MLASSENLSPGGGICVTPVALWLTDNPGRRWKAWQRSSSAAWCHETGIYALSYQG